MQYSLKQDPKLVIRLILGYIIVTYKYEFHSEDNIRLQIVIGFMAVFIVYGVNWAKSDIEFIKVVTTLLMFLAMFFAFHLLSIGLYYLPISGKKWLKNFVRSMANFTFTAGTIFFSVGFILYILLLLYSSVFTNNLATESVKNGNFATILIILSVVIYTTLTTSVKRPSNERK